MQRLAAIACGEAQQSSGSFIESMSLQFLRAAESPKIQGSEAATTGNVVIVDRLLLKAGKIRLILTALLIVHAGKHFAIPPRRLIRDDLPGAQLLQLLKLLFEILPCLLKLIDFTVKIMKIAANEGLENVGAARDIRFRDCLIGAFERVPRLRNFKQDLL
jgi:hypothetical protein